MLLEYLIYTFIKYFFRSFRTLYDFDLNEAIDVYDYFFHINVLFSCKNFEYLTLPKFQFMKSRKLSKFCTKTYEKSLN